MTDVLSPAAATVTAAARRGADRLTGAGPAGRRGPARSMAASALVPGLGSALNGRYGKGLGIFAGFVASAALTVMLIGFFGLVGFWIWGVLDAYEGPEPRRDVSG